MPAKTGVFIDMSLAALAGATPNDDGRRNETWSDLILEAGRLGVSR